MLHAHAGLSTLERLHWNFAAGLVNIGEIYVSEMTNLYHDIYGVTTPATPYKFALWILT